MALNDLADSFCYSQKNAGLKGLMRASWLFTVRDKVAASRRGPVKRRRQADMARGQLFAHPCCKASLSRECVLRMIRKLVTFRVTVKWSIWKTVCNDCLCCALLQLSRHSSKLITSSKPLHP